MNKTLKGYVLGFLSTAILTGGVVLAKTATEQIEVFYNNIKVYKDNVLCELKDSNGTVIEPFIYNGTTYMPVRGTANLAGMEVTWEGSTQSVYLWDEVPNPDGTYLLDVCPPYETNGYKEYIQQKGGSFQMAGTKYTNGFTLDDNYKYALFNLNSKYSTIEFTIGHVDGSDMSACPVQFYVDGKLIKEMTIEGDALPQTIQLPVSYGLQLKVFTPENVSEWPIVGFGNITVK